MHEACNRLLYGYDEVGTGVGDFSRGRAIAWDAVAGQRSFPQAYPFPDNGGLLRGRRVAGSPPTCAEAET